jgi:hypothetical protein
MEIEQSASSFGDRKDSKNTKTEVNVADKEMSCEI